MLYSQEMRDIVAKAKEKVATWPRWKQEFLPTMYSYLYKDALLKELDEINEEEKKSTS